VNWPVAGPHQAARADKSLCRSQQHRYLRKLLPIKIKPWIAVGTGKTHLAAALGHIAVRRRVSVLMVRADKLFKTLKGARLDNTLAAEMRRLAHVQLLIIDDFCLQSLDAIETADFYELVVERHQKVSTVVTSNRGPDEWLGLMADVLLAQSAVDRLTSTAHELVVDGESYRRRQRPSVTKARNETGGAA
jgi:DNA replication protein DnaC